jgi:hypothetical protein
MAETDMAQVRQADQPGHCVPNFREHAAQTGVKQQRFVVPNQEVIELQISPGGIDRNSINIRSNLMDGCHISPRPKFSQGHCDAHSA